MDKFKCCNEPAKFKKIKDGYECVYCGKIYPRKSILFQDKNMDINSEKLKGITKFRGRKAEYLNSQRKYFTLETGKVNMYEYSEDTFNYIKTINVKKNVLLFSVNDENSLLTVSERGVLESYSIDNATVINSIKTGERYTYIEICPAKNGWIYCDREKLQWFSSDLSHKENILSFTDIDLDDVWHVNRIEQNDSNDVFIVSFWYRTEKNQSSKVGIVKIFVNPDGSFSYEFFELPFGYYSYEFSKQLFYSVYKNILYIEENNIKKEIEVPIIRKYSDGNILWFEEFFDYPKNIQLISEKVFGLWYDQDYIIYDIKNQIVLKWYNFEYNLIQSVVFINKNMISISAGLNSYIVNTGA